MQDFRVKGGNCPTVFAALHLLPSCVLFLLGVGGKLCSLMGHLSRELVAESRILLSEYDLMGIAWPAGTFAAKLRKLVSERKRETVSCECNGTACVCKQSRTSRDLFDPSALRNSKTTTADPRPCRKGATVHGVP